MVNQMAQHRLRLREPRHVPLKIPLKALSVMVPILIAAMLIAGCGTQAGTAILSYERNNIAVPPMTVVDNVGLYALFPGDGITPLDAVYLQKGDKFGFRSKEGTVMGAYIKAGETKLIPLDAVLTSEYIWRYQGDRKP